MTIREVEDANGYRNYTQAEVDILLKIRLLRIGFIGRLLLFYASLALMLAFEPLLLHFFGATPGKAILGLRIETSDGSCLSLSAARSRTRGVFRTGLGFALPVYHLYRGFCCLQLCRAGVPLPWDKETDSVCIKKGETIGLARGIICALFFGLLAGLPVLTVLQQRLAPNRGALSVAQFVENFEYFADYSGYDRSSLFFDAEGQPQRRPQGQNGSYLIDTTESALREFSYETEGGQLTAGGIAIRCELETENLFDSGGGFLVPNGDGPHRFSLRFTAQICD